MTKGIVMWWVVGEEVAFLYYLEMEEGNNFKKA